MNTVSKIRVLPLLGAIALILAAACADTATGPQVPGKRSLRDTTVVEGDSTACLRGYIVFNGRVVCN